MSRKRILLIAPAFFDYYKNILAELQNMGYEADYICDTYSNSSFSKALGRINKKLIQGSMRKAFSKDILPKIQKKDYDVILVVAGMTFAFSSDMVERIRKIQSGAEFILYQWDSEENLPYIMEIQPFFDKIYSFDPVDCKKNEACTFLPLFYNRQYEEIGKRAKPFKWKYDCSYFGTAHPQKYERINQMSKALKDLMPRQYIYHYMPSCLKYVYHKLFAEEFRSARLSEFQKEKLPTGMAAKIFEQSKCILDAPQAGQRGLTIRTIECLGAKRKLITTNTDVKNYDFYRETNIFVFQGEVDNSGTFFTKEYEDLPEEIYHKYSLRQWIGTLLETTKNMQKC